MERAQQHSVEAASNLVREGIKIDRESQPQLRKQEVRARQNFQRNLSRPLKSFCFEARSWEFVQLHGVKDSDFG